MVIGGIQCLKMTQKKGVMTHSGDYKEVIQCVFVLTQGAGAIDASRLQLPLSTSVLGSSHHLHGLGDFLDVLDGLQPNGD